MDLALLESVSEYLAKIVFWWIHAVDGVPEDKLAIYTYVGGSFLVLVLLYFVLKILPKSLRGIVWIISAAVLSTPGTTLGNTGDVAPAIIDVLHGFLMKDTPRAISSMLSIIAMIIAGLALGAIWQMLYATIQDSLNSKKRTG